MAGTRPRAGRQDRGLSPLEPLQPARLARLGYRVATRAEFSDLLWELQGELGTSHAYEMGGDYRGAPSFPQGLLGADLALDADGTWRVARLPRGDSWDASAASPLAL